MRLLFVSQSSPFREGGIETRSREVALRLARQGHEITYLCAKTKLDEIPSERRDGIRILRKKVLPDWLLKRFPFPHYFTLAVANLLMGFYLWGLLRRESFDAIREEVAPAPISGFLAFRRLKMRRIAVVHGLPRDCAFWLRLYGPVFGFYGFLMECALRRGWLAFDGILVPAKWYAESLRSHPAIADQVHLVPNGVDWSGFSPPPAPVEKQLLSRMVSVGRLAPNKGQRYLLEALALAKREIPELQLTILGRGALEDSLRRRARRLGIESSVNFLSYIEGADVPSFYRRFDLLVMPSLLEGFNLVLLEAMASGLPVLASDIPGFRDVADSTMATFFKAADSRDLAEKLKTLARDPARASAIAAKASTRIVGLGWDEIALRELAFLTGQAKGAAQSPLGVAEKIG